MNHYPHHIGDFNNATRHLTRLERSIYRDLLDLYYDTEQPIENDLKKLFRKLSATTKNEIAAVRSVLEEFFVLQEDNAWHNTRCDVEIARFQGKSSKAKASAQARWKSDSSNASAMRSHSEGNANQNQNHISNTDVLDMASQSSPTPGAEQVPDPAGDKTLTQRDLITKHGINPQVAKDFLAIRKTKRAPLTPTALAAIEREAQAAGITLAEAVRCCAENGWQGFRQAWYENLLAPKQAGKPARTTIPDNNDTSWLDPELARRVGVIQ